MKYEYYKTLLGEYINVGRSKERLLGEIGYPEEITLTVEGLTMAVSIIVAAAEADIKRIVDLSGLSMRAFAAKYSIPYRTVQDWCSGSRKPPEYLPMMIGYLLISELPEDAGNGDI